MAEGIKIKLISLKMFAILTALCNLETIRHIEKLCDSETTQALAIKCIEAPSSWLLKSFYFQACQAETDNPFFEIFKIEIKNQNIALFSLFFAISDWFEFNGFEYFVSDSSLQLRYAYEDCLRMEANLLSIETEEEQNFINDILIRFTPYR